MTQLSEARTCCAIGGQIAGDPATDLIHELHGGPYVRRVLAETQRLAVIPSLGALAYGHVLITPRGHRRSWASATAEERESLSETLDPITQELERRSGGSVHIFEHGSSAGGASVACSVEHAHLHLVPAEVEIWSGLATRFQWQEVFDLEELDSAAEGHEYLLYRPPYGGFHISLHDEGVLPSQLLRRVLADSLADPDWNWRVTPRLDLVERIFYELSESLGESLRQRSPAAI